MQQTLELIAIYSHPLFVMSLGWYLILNLQWHNYQLERVVFNHTKPLWHLSFLLVPIMFYYATSHYFWIYFYFVHLSLLYFWYRKIDKKLVYTPRVLRFLSMLFVAVVAQDIACYFNETCQNFGVLMPLIAVYILSHLTENWLRKRFKLLATKKIEKRSDLTVVAITASYGKTSIKNILYELVKDDFNAYKTPGNVNTDLGIAKDINNDLPDDTNLYIVEAGAREKGDILTITLLVKPHYAIVGKVGAQHIEFFKTIDNVRSTKRELLVSPRMKRGVVHNSASVKPNSEVIILEDKQISNVVANLDGTSWDLDLNGETYHLSTPLLGSFNAINISLAFIMAKELKIDTEKLIRKINNLKPIQHRLEPIRTGTKLIIDDSYNGNFEGIMEAINLAKTYEGKKVIVTPSLVESDIESNRKLAQEINKVFDLVMITGELNRAIYKEIIDSDKLIVVEDKKELETLLSIHTHAGYLILFANDAPTFI